MATTDKQQGWMTAQEMGDYLCISPKTVLKLARNSVIPCIRYGQIVRFKLEDVEAALARPGRGRR